MIPRYTRPEMARIWSDENRFRTWLAVEVAATETLAEAGLVPKDSRQDYPRTRRLQSRTHPRNRSRSPPRCHCLHDSSR